MKIVAFFSLPVLLAGLHFLTAFDWYDNAVTAQFSSGCGAIFSLPFAKADLLAPGPIIGLFDPLARPYVEKNLLTFPVPAGLFVRMVENVLESFLGNRTWGTIRRRIQG